MQNLLQCLRILKLFLDLSNDVLGQLLLLFVLDLSFVSNPRVESGLGLRCQCCLLLELVDLSLELCGFLLHCQHTCVTTAKHPSAYFRNFEKTLCNIDDTAHLLYGVNSPLHSIDVSLFCFIQHIAPLVNEPICPLAVPRSSKMEKSPEDSQSGHHDNGFMVDHIILVADEVGRDRGTSGKDGRLRDQGRAGKSINYGLRSLRRRLRGDVGSITMGGQRGRNGRERSACNDRSELSGAFEALVSHPNRCSSDFED